MLIKHYSIFFTSLLLLSSCISDSNNRRVNEKTEEILNNLSLDEKIDLLGCSGNMARGNERLKISPLYMTDGTNGVATGKATAFPVGLMQAATWDTLLVADIAKAIAVEARAKGMNFLFGPDIDIMRLPVAGRNFESFGEDPFLTSRFAVGFIKSVQNQGMISCAKHMLCNSQEHNRNEVNVIVSQRALREIYLPAFYSAVKEAGVLSIITAKNKVNGAYCSENGMLLNNILKEEWGFKGFVISDWVSVYNTQRAVNSGLDLEMPEPVFFQHDSLVRAINESKISLAAIDDKVRRVLRARILAESMGHSSPPDTSVINCADHRALALRAAQEGLVLLKNQDALLPFDTTKIRSIAIIGPNADALPWSGQGSAFVSPFYTVSPLAGIRKKAGALKIEYSKGDVYKEERLQTIDGHSFYLSDLKDSHGLKAEYFDNLELAGKPVVTRIDKQINFDFKDGSPIAKLKSDSFSIRWSGYIVPDETDVYRFQSYSDDGIRLIIDNEILINNWSQHAATLNVSEKRLEAGKPYKFVLEYYEMRGESVIQLGWTPKSKTINNFIQEAMRVAARNDVVVLCLGSGLNSEGEGQDRDGLRLPGNQDILTQSVLSVNPHTVVVLFGGGPYTLDPWLEKTPALINMFFPGQEGGTALADALFGDINPSGKLPFSYIRSTSQSPAFNGYQSLDQKSVYSEGIFIGYRYLDKNKIEPWFPFGFGLSYTTFDYKNIKVEQLEGGMVEVSCDVTNTGKRDGDEVVQVYVHDIVCSLERPEKELKGFSRVSLAAGETHTVKIMLVPSAFMFFNPAKNSWEKEPGDFEIMVGSSSRDIRLMQKIRIK